jgi:hypothetical protein
MGIVFFPLYNITMQQGLNKVQKVVQEFIDNGKIRVPLSVFLVAARWSISRRRAFPTSQPRCRCTRTGCDAIAARGGISPMKRQLLSSPHAPHSAEMLAIASMTMPQTLGPGDLLPSRGNDSPGIPRQRNFLGTQNFRPRPALIGRCETLCSGQGAPWHIP